MPSIGHGHRVRFRVNRSLIQPGQASCWWDLMSGIDDRLRIDAHPNVGFRVVLQGLGHTTTLIENEEIVPKIQRALEEWDRTIRWDFEGKLRADVLELPETLGEAFARFVEALPGFAEEKPLSIERIPLKLTQTQRDTLFRVERFPGLTQGDLGSTVKKLYELKLVEDDARPGHERVQSHWLSAKHYRITEDGRRALRG